MRMILRAGFNALIAFAALALVSFLADFLAKSMGMGSRPTEALALELGILGAAIALAGLSWLQRRALGLSIESLLVQNALSVGLLVAVLAPIH